MKKINFKSRKLKPVKESQKISKFFIKQPACLAENTKCELKTPETVRSNSTGVKENIRTTVYTVDSDDDIVPPTPDVRQLKKIETRKKFTNKQDSKQCETKILEIITNTENTIVLKKRKLSDCTDVEEILPDESHKPVKKCNRNFDMRPINVSNSSDDEVQSKQDVQNDVSKMISSLCSTSIKHITLDENNTEHTASNPHEISPRRSPRIKGLFERNLDKAFSGIKHTVNENNAASENRILISPHDSAPLIEKLYETDLETTPSKTKHTASKSITANAKQIMRKETPSTIKRTPQKLFDKSVNGDFKVEILENFIKITPSKSNKKMFVKTKTPTKTADKKQASILEFMSPSKSCRSAETQKQNESTPIKSPGANMLPSTSKVKVKLDFSFTESTATHQDTNWIREGDNIETINNNLVSNGGNLHDSVALLADCWDDDFTICSQDDYLLDLHQMQYCVISEITKTNCKMCLVVQSTKTRDKARCTLDGFWIYSKLQVDSIVYICAVKDHTDWIINNEHGMLVYEPDFLISSTSVVGALFCKRRSVLKERFFGFETENKAMVIGILVHTLLQRALKFKVSSVQETENILKKILIEKDTIRFMYTTSLTLDDLQKDLLVYVPRVVAFMNCYVLNSKTSMKNQQDWRGSIDAVQDIEENIWCPELGLKGKVDVSIQYGSNVMPLELKTGRALISLEHRGQVMLYIMMMSKLGYKISSGLLLYLREGVLREVSCNQQEKRDLILLRNELTYYLTRKSQVQSEIEFRACDKGASGSNNAEIASKLKVPELPDPINHHSACGKCPYNIICCSYLRHEHVDLSNNKALQLVKDEVLVHLSDAHIQYFIHWSSLLDLECSETSGKDVRSIYTQTPQERELHGKCITSVTVTSLVMECDGFYKQTFQKIDPSNTANFLTSGICESSYVVVSTDTRPAVAAGMVTYMDHSTVTIALDRDLSTKYPKCEFHLDSYDSSSAQAFNYTNLSLLLEPTPAADRLRRLIIDKQMPTFQTKFPKVVAMKATPILRSLNKMQQRAVLKALAANDYVLIKGMPGTGKTATIVALVQLLVEVNQTVLITSHTHMAVDNVCLRLKDCGIKFLRLGADSKIHPKLRSVTEYSLTKDCKTPEELERVYNSAKVLAVTCLGSKHPVLSKRIMDVCVIDESTQVLQCSVLRALTTSKKFVLIGDPDQLPPVVKNREAIANGLSESLFERLQHPEAIVTLSSQYRMNKPITKLANSLTYQGQLLTANETVGNATLRLPKLESFLSKYKQQEWIIRSLDYSLRCAVKVLDTGPVWNLKVNYPWVRKTFVNGIESYKVLHCTNHAEVAVVLVLVNALLQAEVPANSIGVIAPYRAQVARIAEELETTEVDVNTVDQFQGQDRDVIIYSCTKSRDVTKNIPVNKYDILEDKRRLTVAITRAKHKFILIGDLATVQLYTPFSQLLRVMEPHSFITLKNGELGFSWDTLASTNSLE